MSDREKDQAQEPDPKQEHQEEVEDLEVPEGESDEVKGGWVRGDHHFT